MTNTKKLITLGILLIILSALVYLLISTKNVENELKKDAIKEDINNEIEVSDLPVIEVPGEPIVTLNASLNKYLDSFEYKDDIIDRAVAISTKVIENNNTPSNPIIEINISDITLMDIGTEDLHDSVILFQVHLVSTHHDGTKVQNASNYLFYYLRWDDDNQGSYFISSLSDSEIENKYSCMISEESDNILSIACEYEKYEFLKNSEQFLSADLKNVAINKAKSFASSSGKFDSVITENADEEIIESEMCSYTFDTVPDTHKITIEFLFIPETEMWAFYHAYSSEKEQSTTTTDQ